MNPPQILRTYRWMAPLYDALFRRAYQRMRRESIASLHLVESDTVILVGVGTGLDLGLLPPVARIFGCDISLPMLRRAVVRDSVASLALADGARLPMRDASATKAILHLVLGVAPDPGAILADVARALVPGGRITILDHFAPSMRMPAWRRLAGRLPALIGTHFDREFEPMLAGLPLRVVSDRQLVRGVYRHIVLERVPGALPSHDLA